MHTLIQIKYLALDVTQLGSHILLKILLFLQNSQFGFAHLNFSGGSI